MVVDKWQPPIPGTLGRQPQPQSYRREGRGREVPMQARVFSLGLDEQRQSMVLELYCRKAGVREKVERERDWPWPRREKWEKEREREERLE